jgi:16S rRNA G966 N2-methylase RsmD
MATQVADKHRLPPKYYKKLLFLFETYAVNDPHLTRAEIAQLQADAQALYSITPAQDANTMSRLCANLPGMKNLGRKPVITDGCACVGGNVMSFALSGLYAQVNAVEFDESRAQMLEHNVSVIRGRAPCPVNVVTGSYIALMHTLSQDIVFLDPPWGGPGYKDLDTVSLFLSDKHLADIVHDLHSHGQTRYVVWKAPSNFAIDEMKEKLKKFELEMNVLENFFQQKGSDKLKYVLYYVELSKPT